MTGQPAQVSFCGFDDALNALEHLQACMRLHTSRSSRRANDAASWRHVLGAMHAHVTRDGHTSLLGVEQHH